MKNTLLIILLSFYIYFPKLINFPEISYIPKLFLLVLLLFLFIRSKSKLININNTVILFYLYLMGLTVSLVIGNANLVLPLFLYTLLFLCFLVFGNEGVVMAAGVLRLKVDFKYQYIIYLLFIFLPFSLFVQWIYPNIFNLYGQVFLYDDSVTLINSSKLRISGLIGGVGVGATSALATLLIFYEIFIKISSIKYNVYLNFLVRILYLFSISLSGTTGFLLIVIFYLYNLIIYIYKINFIKLLIALSISILFYFIIIHLRVAGLSYFRVILTEGWEGFLSYGSVRVLIAYYQTGFMINIEKAINLGQLFGNLNAGGRYELSDIGLINQINITGLYGYFLFNAILIYFIKLSFPRLNSEAGNLDFLYVKQGIFSLSLYLIIIQFKEFVSFQGSGPAALLIILIIYYQNQFSPNQSKLISI